MPQQQTLVFDDLEVGERYQLTFTDGASLTIYFGDFVKMPAGNAGKAYYCLRGIEPAPNRENNERPVMFPTDEIRSIVRV